VDIVGTGGDGAHTFNISTASMFVAAAAGATVAKHGNRSVSSKSGAADVLEAFGANIMLTPAQVGECIEAIGCGFMFAPNHHPAMKNVAPVRREMGVRTIFNILGPLTNPAGAPNTLMGVFHPDLVGIQVRVMKQLGADHVMVVWGKDGMDEISLGAATLVGELKNGEITEYEIHPEDYGLAMMSNRGLRVADATESKPCCSRRWTTRPARRAKSSRSTPVPRSTPPTWSTRSAKASPGRAKPSPAARRAGSSTNSSPSPRSSADGGGHPRKDPRRQARGSSGGQGDQAAGRDAGRGRGAGADERVCRDRFKQKSALAVRQSSPKSRRPARPKA
jgi:hypothetical protein